MTALDDWIALQRIRAVAGLLRCISSSQTKTRSGFGQIIVPRRGSVIASPVLADWDPEPDYFFHWYRDSALIIDALRLVQDDVPQARQHLADFTAFSLELAALDGRDLPSGWQARVAPDFVRFLRRDIAQAHGDAVAADTRVNPDGTLDISDWPRPQYDGPALRALALLRWGVESEAQRALLTGDLRFLLAHARQPCFDIWEEESGLHYHTLRVGEAALRHGAAWLDDPAFAAACRREADTIAVLLERFWSAEQGFICAHRPAQAAKGPDIAVILAANHAQASPDARLTATLDRLADHFRGSLSINRGVTDGPAMGRYPGDTYFSGGAWFIATLGAAEYCYRMGDARRGDSFLETVRRFAPGDGQLPEQFDRDSGAPSSAQDLGWSHAAVLSCIAARTPT